MHYEKEIVPWQSFVSIFCSIGNRMGSIWTKRWGSMLIDSRMTLMARKQPSAPREPGPSALDFSKHLQHTELYKQNGGDVKCIVNEKVRKLSEDSSLQYTRFWHKPTAYGAISSPNLTKIVSRQSTRSSFSTSFISLKISVDKSSSLDIKHQVTKRYYKINLTFCLPSSN